MKLTNAILLFVAAVVAWKFVLPSVQQQFMLPPGTTPTQQPNASTPPAGQGGGDVFTSVVSALEGIFGAVNRIAQTSAKTT